MQSTLIIQREIFDVIPYGQPVLASDFYTSIFRLTKRPEPMGAELSVEAADNRRNRGIDYWRKRPWNKSTIRHSLLKHEQNISYPIQEGEHRQDPAMDDARQRQPVLDDIRASIWKDYYD